MPSHTSLVREGFDYKTMRNSKGQFLKGHIPWNKGLKGYTNRGSFQKGHKGFRKFYLKGTHYSPKTEFKKGLIPWIKGKHPIAWNKGLGKGIRTERMKEMDGWRYIQWRRKVFQRDNYICQKCRQKGGKLIADHIKMWLLYPELRYNINNGQTLCKDCSMEKTKKELSIYWKNQYKLYQENKIGKL